MRRFRLVWLPANAYVYDLSNAHPYTTDPLKAKTWKSQAAVERYLLLKDRSWAAQCQIEAFELVA